SVHDPFTAERASPRVGRVGKLLGTGHHLVGDGGAVHAQECTPTQLILAAATVSKFTSPPLSEKIPNPGRTLMATYRLRVNNRPVTVESWDPGQPLLYVLRNSLGLHGPKFGGGLGHCGSCTVLSDGTSARSCIVPVTQAAGRAV